MVIGIGRNELIKKMNELTWSLRIHRVFLFERRRSKQLRPHTELRAQKPSSAAHFCALKTSPACSLHSRFASFPLSLVPFFD